MNFLTQDNLKKERKKMNVPVKSLAGYLNMDISNYRKIENCKKKCSDDFLDKINRALFELSSEARLEMLFDYVRIRFNYSDVDEFLDKILRMKKRFFEKEPRGFYGYTNTYSFGNIKFFTSSNSELGILLELTGKGCREFESVLKAQQRDWYTFFQKVIDEKGVFKRLDLAIDDRYYLINIPFLIEKIEMGDVISVFRNFRVYKSGEVKEDGDKNIGNTVYIGSSKSEVVFCIYEKNYERLVKEGISLEDSEVKNRFEIRLKNERAKKAIENILLYDDLSYVVLGIINRYVKVVDKNGSEDYRDFTINDRWKYFLDDVKHSLKLTTEPEPFDIKRTYKWLYSQVAPTLSLINKLDEVYGTVDIQELINSKMGERQIAIYNSMTADIEDIVY